MTDELERLTAALADRYAIQRELGRGGMATVYLARDLKHDRKVALKVLKPELAAAVGTDRFLREIRVAARLNHPHILPLLDSGDADGTLYFTMPLVQGPSLADRIRTEGPLGVDEIRALVNDLAAALGYAHEQGIVHRDIKPENVLLHHDKPMIADFGIALAVSRVGRDRLTETGLSIGTPHYMSPEQVSGDRTLDARSDIYALGCVVYEMVVGDPPFTGRTAQAVMARQVTDPAPPIRTVRCDVPAAVDAAVTKALAKVPGDRFASVADFARALAASEVTEPATRAAVSAAPMDDRPTVAVLPFANVGQDPGNEYFAEGVWEDVLANLSRVDGLRAISRTSCLRYKDTAKSMREVGEELGAGMILEGSVRRAAGRVRVVVQLVDAKADEQRWAETYDRELTDIFAIQSEVALSVVTALQAALTPGERERLRQRPTDDLAVYDLYLLGRHHLNKRTDGDLRLAIGHFESALALDPRFAGAHAGLAEAYLFAGMGYAAMPPKEALPKAKAAAARAIELDSSSAEAHATHGFVTLVCDWDPDAAVTELRQAIESNPNRPEPHQWLAWCLVARGEIAAGLESWERALEADPLSAVVINENGWPYSYTGLDEQALQWYRRAIEVEPALALAHYNAGWALHRLGRLDEAIPAYERGVAMSGGAPFMRAFLATAFADSGRTEDARLILEDLLARAAHAHGIGLSIALTAESLGEQELALHWLDQAFEERDPFLFTLPLDDAWMSFSSLRDHPRFRALLDRIGIGRSLPPNYRARERAKILARSAAPGAQESAVADRSSSTGVAVLPFENLSPDPDNAYFSDGITEDIIAHLCRIPGFKVISRTSVMQFKHRRDVTLRQIGEELDVEAILEGSVRRAGDRLRIVTTLIESHSENHLWTNTYDRRLTDVFEIQTEVATNIAAALRTTLSLADQAKLEKVPTANMDAYGLWLRGRSTWAEMNAEALQRSLALFHRAIDLDPGFPHPYIGVADACIWQGIGLGIGTPEENRDAAKTAALRDLELDETLAEAHSSLAHVQCWFEWDWKAAEHSFKRALELNPSYALAREGYATLLTCTGLHEAALAELDRAEELDPLSLELKRTRGWLLWHARDHTRAFATLQQVLSLDPVFVPALLTIPWVATELGKTEEAIEYARMAIEKTNGNHVALAALAYAHARSGQSAESRRVLDEIWALPESNRQHANGHAVPVYVALGDRNRALQHLEVAVRKREPMLMYLEVGAHFDGLRAEPRFREVARELGQDAGTADSREHFAG
jgi:serine/threonine-protein kinase